MGSPPAAWASAATPNTSSATSTTTRVRPMSRVTGGIQPRAPGHNAVVPMDALTRLAREGVYVGITAWTEPTLVDAGYYPEGVESAEARLRHYETEFQITEEDAHY